MKNFGAFLLLAVLAIGAGYLSGQSASDQSAVAQKETTYERVMRTRTLRCGYNFWEPGVVLNTKTNKLEGAYIEIMDAISNVTGLKIEWVEQVDWGQVTTAVQSGRVDAICAGYWANARTGMHMAYSTPPYFEAVRAYARVGDTRFDEDLSHINQPDITIAVIDEDIAHNIARNDFPAARTLSAPQMSTEDQLALMVETGKADITFMSAGNGVGYMRANPGKIKPVMPDRAFRTFGGTVAVDIQEQTLKAMLDSAIVELRDSGVITKILAKYEDDYPGLFLPVIKPYKNAGS